MSTHIRTPISPMSARIPRTPTSPMSPDISKEPHLSYEEAGGDLQYVTSNAKTVTHEHKEHASTPSTAGGDPEMAEMTALEEAEYVWCRIRRTMQEPFSEFFGVMVLILFGDGVVAQVVLSNGTKGDYQSISWCWGIGVMIGVYVSRKSGGHINPAVTLANCVFRGFPWRKFPIYFVAQLLGGMAGAAIVYGNYRGAIDVFEGGPGIRTVGLNTSSAGIFCTYPAPFMTRTSMFWDEFIGSSILMFCIYAFLDAGAGELMPLCLFFLIFGIGATFGWQTGYAINLARDFGPRLVSYMLGYGSEVWSAGNYYFWIPMVAPFLGCLFGGFLHDTFLYQGSTPINTPWMGLKRLTSATPNTWSNTRMRSLSSNV